MFLAKVSEFRLIDENFPAKAPKNLSVTYYSNIAQYNWAILDEERS